MINDILGQLYMMILQASIFIKQNSNKNMLDSFPTINSQFIFNSGFRPKDPRCLSEQLAKRACVTQSCKQFPFMCQSTYHQCNCQKPHQFCKSMDWSSVLSMLSNYQAYECQELQAYAKKVQQIYRKSIKKLSNELEYFYEWIETQLYELPYQRIKHFIQQEQFSKITSNDLGSIITKLTKEKTKERKLDYQISEFSLHEIKEIERAVDRLLRDIENLYERKFIVKGQSPQFQKRKNKSGDTKKKYSMASSSIQQKETLCRSNIKSQRYIGSSTKISSKDPRIEFRRFIQSASTNFTHQLKRTYSHHKINKKEETQDQQTMENKLIEKKSVIYDYPILIGSKILKNGAILNALLNVGKIKEYKLLYRASQNKYSVPQFYHKMKLRYTQTGSDVLTVFLFKTQHSKIIAGSTRLQWIWNPDVGGCLDDECFQESNNIQKYRQDIRGTTFLYSIDSNQRYQLKDPHYAIYCGKNSIGFGEKDIRIYSACHKHSKNFMKFPSSFNNGAYVANRKSSMMLSGSHNSNTFKVVEWQVFEVKLQPQKRQVQR